MQISTHSPRVGRDINTTKYIGGIIIFQPTLPVWGETQGEMYGYDSVKISTHSPRVGRDACEYVNSFISAAISTHSPRVGRDEHMYWFREKFSLFQPTLPVWGETLNSLLYVSSPPDFNPLSPCGERQRHGKNWDLSS